MEEKDEIGNLKPERGNKDSFPMFCFPVDCERD